MFWLVPRPQGHHAPQNGSPRMFRVEWIEKYLSRVKPWQVVVAALSVMILGAFRRLTGERKEKREKAAVG